MIEKSSHKVNKNARTKNPNITPTTIDPAENAFEQKIRPKLLSDFLGQTQLKSNLQIFIKAAQQRQEPLEHILFYGPPGLGKTTLANIIAHELNANLRISSGPAIEKQGDLAAILSSLTNGDVLFIDEIHRLKPQIEEILYSSMEDFALDIMVGAGVGARSMRLSLPKFTLIGATTRASNLSSPLRDRFGHIFKLDFYDEAELALIIKRSAKILQCTIDHLSCQNLAKRCRRTPRIANRLLKRVRDFAQILNEGKIDNKLITTSLTKLNIDELGLDKLDYQVLTSLAQNFNGGPVGLNTLAASISEETETIADVCEPYLLQIGFIQRTPRGRIITTKALNHLKLPIINNNNPKQKLL